MIHLLTPLFELDEPRDILLDLQKLIFIGPSALALLTAAVKRVDGQGYVAEGIVVMPESPQMEDHLARMDFIRVLRGEEVEIASSSPPAGFLPCRHFGEDDYQIAAAELTRLLSERCSTDSVAEHSIRICLEELTENVVHHADCPQGGFAAAQGWSRRSEFEIGIADLGIGIRASLTKNPLYAAVDDDLVAIETAIKPRVTETPDRNAGIGLFVTKLLLRANGGLLMIRSGYGAVYSGHREDGFVRKVSLPGTLVTIRALADRELNINAVYRELNAYESGNHDQAS
jgi:anti-anti-sigma regulatory factor/anti-sigma regulatory factor (Ser/Thr protein kinase)